MSDESRLRLIAREAIRAGKLPNRRPERMWGGLGAGAPCRICGDPVKHDEVEYELEFSRGDDDPDEANGGMGHHLHLRCFSAWEFERKLERQDSDAIREEVRSSERAPLGVHSSVPAGASESNSGTAVGSRVLPETTTDGTLTGCERDTTCERGSS